MFSIDSNLNQLNMAIKELKKEKENIEENIEETQLETNIQNILQNLFNAISINQIIPDDLRNKVVNSLLTLEELVKGKLSGNKVNDISSNIFKIQTNLIGKIRTGNFDDDFKIDLSMGIYINFYSTDYNGAFLESVIGAIQENYLFITTRSLIQGCDVHNCNKSLLKSQEAYYELLQAQERWDIYELCSTKEILLFLPKGLLPEKQGFEKLKALDFNSDPIKIRRISVHDVFKSYEGKHAGNFYSIYEIFTEEPKLNKAFHLGGHGDSGSIASLPITRYNAFLTFLKKQHCKALTIDSCQAGGIVSLHNISHISSINQENHPQVLTIVHSFSDAFSQGQDIVDKHAGETLNGIVSSFEKGGIREMSIQKVFDAIDKSPDKYHFNLAKVLLPYSPRVSSGFRPVGERGWIYSITYADCQRVLLQSQKPFAKSSHPNDKLDHSLVIDDKKNIAIHPLIIECPVIFKKQDPQMASMIPGHAAHYFKEIILSGDFDKFVKNTVTQAKNLQVSKSFFIETLNSSQGVYEQVVIFIIPHSFFWGYKQGNEFYITWNENKRNVSELEFVRFWESAINMTLPNDDAARSSTGGMQKSEMLQNRIRESVFETSITYKTQGIIALGIYYTDFDSDWDKICQETDTLSKIDQTALMFLFMKRGHSDVSFKMIKHYNLDVNSIDIDGVPLICLAIYSQFSSMIKYIINNKADVNVSDPYLRGNSVLHSLVAYELIPLIEVLLNSRPEVNLNAKNLDEITPIELALNLKNPKIFNLLLSKLSSIDELSKGETLFGKIVSYYGFGNHHLDMKIDRLIKAKADPNKGSPSALIQAIKSKNSLLIEKLLQAGGKPFEKDDGGSIPFIQAILQGSRLTVIKFLNHPNCHLDISDDREISPLIAALLTNNKEVLQLLEKEKISFPNIFNHSLPQQCIKNLILNLYVYDDIVGLKKLFSWRRLPCPQFDDMFFHIFIQKPDLLAECIKEKLIDLDKKSLDPLNLNRSYLDIILIKSQQNPGIFATLLSVTQKHYNQKI